MSMVAEAIKTIQSVLLLQAKVERLDDELRETRGQMKQMANAMIALDRRLVRLETFEEMRTGRNVPRLE
jgi:hypothetical protein